MNVTLQRTNDYSIFNAHEVNRLLIKDGSYEPRKDLIASMKKEGFRPANAINCIKEHDGTLTIIDGHNRFASARFLGLPVYYFAFPKAAEVSPLEYSRDQKGWSIAQKVQSYARTNADYAELVAFSESTKISMHQSANMFVGGTASANNASKTLPQGLFKIKDRGHPWMVASIVREMQRHCDFATKQNCVSAISKAVFADGFDPEKMRDKISRHPELLKPQRSLEDYIEMLDAIYNRHVKGDRYHLRIEIDKAMKKRVPIVFSKEPK